MSAKKVAVHCTTLSEEILRCYQWQNNGNLGHKGLFFFWKKYGPLLKVKQIYLDFLLIRKNVLYKQQKVFFFNIAHYIIESSYFSSKNRCFPRDIYKVWLRKHDTREVQNEAKIERFCLPLAVCALN